ncbi:MAG: hypothetical protein ACRBDL_08230 [Alphaproteobacteria bacterium]
MDTNTTDTQDIRILKACLAELYRSHNAALRATMILNAYIKEKEKETQS